MSIEVIRPARTLQGSLTVPGDKSISHRYAMLAGLAEGTTRLSNFSTGADPASSLACMEALGATVVTNGEGPARILEVTGTAGSFMQPSAPLDCGNSGSTMRMLSGLIAPHPHTFTLIGDHSLTLRPMERIRKPLSHMGAKIELTAGAREKDGHAPITIHGGPLQAIDFDTPIPSAQVKTAVLFAGLQATGTTSLSEAVRTRDHSEHALRAFGATLTRTGSKLSIPGHQKLAAIDASVPGDLSSAAFFLCAALLFPDSNLILDSIGMNPTRTALLDVLGLLGAKFKVLNVEEHHGEMIGTIQVNVDPTGLRGADINGALSAMLIDELPVLAAIAPYTRDGIRIRDAKELRVKESDRIALSGQKPHRHGREVYRVRRRPRHSRKSGTPWRPDRLRHRSPHRHGLLDRSPARLRRYRDSRRRSRRHLLPGVLHSPARTLPAMKDSLAASRPIVITEIEQFGGAERSLLALSGWLHRRGLSHYLLTCYDHCHLARYASHPVTVIALNPPRRARQKIAALRRHFAERRSSPWQPLLSGYQPALHATLAGLRGFHVLMHDTPSLFGDQDRRSLKQKLRVGLSNRIIGWGLRSGGKTIVTSEFLRSECRRDFGVEAEIARMGGLTTNGAPRVRVVDRHFNMLSVCRVESNKRIDWILRALSALERGASPLSTRIDWQLHLVGDGSQIPSLREMASQLGIGHRVQFHGFVSDEDLAALYEEAHLFLMPAIQGYGIPAIESPHPRRPRAAAPRIGRQRHPVGHALGHRLRWRRGTNAACAGNSNRPGDSGNASRSAAAGHPHRRRLGGPCSDTL